MRARTARCSFDSDRRSSVEAVIDCELEIVLELETGDSVGAMKVLEDAVVVPEVVVELEDREVVPEVEVVPAVEFPKVDPELEDVLELDVLELNVVPLETEGMVGNTVVDLEYELEVEAVADVVS